MIVQKYRLLKSLRDEGYWIYVLFLRYDDALLVISDNTKENGMREESVF